MIERTPIAVFEGEVNSFEEVDYLEEARKLVTAQFENKDVFDRYVQLLLAGKPELSTVFKQVMQERSLDSAVGEQLNVIGRIVGQDRQLFDSAIIYYFGFNGAVGASPYGTVAEEETSGFWKSLDDPLLGVRSLTDAEYRTLIKIKIIKNTSNADITSFTDAVRLLFGTEEVTYQENNATITLNIGRDYNNQTESIFPGLDEVVLASRFLNVPIGVQLFLQPPTTLELDFEGQSFSSYEEGSEVLQPQVFGDFLILDRNSTGTYYDNAGVLQTAAVDEPRFTHNPATLEAKGILLEEQRTNLLAFSEALSDASWTKANASIAASSETAPDGVGTFEKLVEDGTTNVHNVSKSVSITANDEVSITVYAKAGERNWLRILAEDGSDSIEAWFYLTTGLVGTLKGTGAGSPTTSSIEDIGGGIYRCELTGVVNSTSTSVTCSFGLGDAEESESYVGDGTSGLYLWGTQAEVGGFITSYIPTTTVAVTREADYLSLSTLSPWFNDIEGTFVLHLGDKSPKSGSYNLRLDNFASRNGSTGTHILYQRFGGVNDVNSEIELADDHKVGISYNLSAESTKIAADGNPEKTGFIPNTATFSSINIGSFAANNSVINSTIRSISYTPKELTNTELIFETAPEGVTLSELELDLTSDPSMSFDTTTDESVIQSEE